MNRSELVTAVATEAELDPKECDRIVRVITETITKSVAQGDKVTISGFGTFERRRRKATVARNPQTGAPMQIAEQNVATFRAGTSLKEAVKGEAGEGGSESVSGA